MRPGLCFFPDATTGDVMTLVRQRFADHFGDLESFGWAVTREDALKALQYFIYWYFLIVNEARLKPNPRTALPYRSQASMAAKH